jgi:uncharacterized SAM-binding protein YcdF (DUF218 family)/NAD-dependent dihydropyrimidine dehydrogenase PreA subunit
MRAETHFRSIYTSRLKQVKEGHRPQERILPVIETQNVLDFLRHSRFYSRHCVHPPYQGGVFFMKAYITINRELCKECHLCIWACKRMLISPTEELNSRGYHPVTFRPGETYDAVIVLAGMVEGASRQDGGRLGLASEGDRIVRAFELLREGRARNALLSGGFVDPRPGEPSEAEVLAEMLRTWGIEPERIAVEGRSRNTRENAVESARIVAERGWKRLLLVTSAAHMPRALGCFRQAGLRPDTLPVDYRVGLRWGGVRPRAKALSQSTDAIRELAGRLVYRVMGYTAD